MFSRALRAAGMSWARGPVGMGPRSRRGLCTSASAAGFLGPATQALGTTLGRIGLGSGVVLGGGTIIYNSVKGEPVSNEDTTTDSIPWVAKLAAKSEEMHTPGQMLRKHPIAKAIVDQDHLFETMIQSNHIREFRCFYEVAARRFHSVVQLGKDVCGFPQTVHGGLTAAIIDETLGGLGVCMWKAGALGVRLPAYTARLEVDYKKKIPAGSVILCTTELEKVEGRKIWMKAAVTNGQGRVYATARALFVAPRMPGEGLAQRIGSLIPAVFKGGRGRGGDGAEGGAGAA